MAYDRYATQFTDKDGNVYGVMDEEAREDKAPVICPTASGAIASFPDGADGLKLRELNVAIEPVQDLHGYDAPWPGGGGKNLLPTRATETINSVKFNTNSDGSVTLTGTATGGNAAFDVGRDKCTLPAGTYTASGTGTMSGASIVIYKIVSGTASVVLQGLGNFTLTEETSIFYRIFVASGTAVSGTCYPMICLSSASNPTTYEPYSNICPISGHTGAVVTRTGVNVLDEQWEIGSLSTLTGQTENDNNKIRSKNYCACKPGKTYRKICSNPATYIWFYDIDKNFISFTTSVADFTTPENCYYFKIRVGDLSHPQNTYNQDISINYPATDTDYHPGSVLSVTIPFGQTVYGGNLTLHQNGSGEVVVDRASVDLGTINWYDTADAHVFRGYVALKAPGIGNFLCQNYVWSGTAATAGNCTMCGVAASPNVYIRDDAYSDAAAFKTAMSGVQLVYELATPITISLSASQITTLLGHNNIFADCGDVSVTYPADSKLYIDNKIAQAIAAALNA